MKLFQLHRKEDKSGISGTGLIANGVIYPNGKVSMCWTGELSSIVIYDNIDIVEKIHGHNGCTEICYIFLDKNYKDKKENMYSVQLYKNHYEEHGHTCYHYKNKESAEKQYRKLLKRACLYYDEINREDIHDQSNEDLCKIIEKFNSHKCDQLVEMEEMKFND